MALDAYAYSIDDTGFQIETALGTVSEEHLDSKALPTMMSARETMVHLYEVYQAFLTEASGGKHEWGAYEVPAEIQADIRNQWIAHRKKAVEVALATEDENVAKMAMAFIAVHDAYHVGQVCANRIALEPDFNPYMIYRH